MDRVSVFGSEMNVYARKTLLFFSAMAFSSLTQCNVVSNLVGDSTLGVTITLVAGTSSEPAPTQFSGSYTNDSTPTFTFSYTAGTATSYTCQVDRLAPTVSTGTATACTSPYTPAALGEGTHRLTIYAYNGTTAIGLGERVFVYDATDPNNFDVTYGTCTDGSPCGHYTVNGTTSTWSFEDSSTAQDIAQIAYVANTTTVVPSTDIPSSAWVNVGPTFSVTLPSYATATAVYLHFFVRDRAGNIFPNASATPPQAMVDASKPDTTLLDTVSFVTASLTLKVDKATIADQDVIQFALVNPSVGTVDPANANSVIPIPTLCPSTEQCAFEFDTSGAVCAGATITANRRRIDISDLASLTSTQLATRIANAVNRNFSSTAASCDSGLNVPSTQSDAVAIHATAVNDTVIFYPNPKLATQNLSSPDADYAYGNKLVALITSPNTQHTSGSHATALRLPNYPSNTIRFTATPGDDTTVTITEGGAHIFTFDQTNTAVSTVGTGETPAQAGTIRISAAESTRSVAHKLANSINKYFAQHINESLRNRIRAYVIRHTPASNSTVHLYRTDDSNAHLVLAAVAGANAVIGRSVATTAFDASHMFYQPFTGGQAISGTLRSSVKTFGPYSGSLNHSINESTSCQSLGNLNIAGTLRDAGVNASTLAFVDYKVRKVSDAQGQPASSGCFNGVFGSAAGMTASCNGWVRLSATRITNSSSGQSQDFNFIASIPKCALDEGGSGTYRLDVRGVDAAGNVETNLPASLSFTYDATSPSSGPNGFDALALPGTRSIQLSFTAPAGLTEDLSQLLLFIERRNKKCDSTAGDKFCTFETPKRGVPYSPGATDLRQRELGGGLVAYVLPATTTTHIDTDLIPGNRYFYRAYYVDHYGNFSQGMQKESNSDLDDDCNGTLIVDDGFNRSDSVHVGNAPPSGLTYREFDWIWGVSDLWENITRIANSHLNFEPIQNNRNAVGAVFLDTAGALVQDGYPSLETIALITTDELVTNTVTNNPAGYGLELQMFSHINTLLGGLEMPFSDSLHNGWDADFRQDGTFNPELGTGATSRTFSPHIMAKFDYDVRAATHFGEAATAATEGMQQGIYYYSPTHAITGDDRKEYVGFSELVDSAGITTAGIADCSGAVPGPLCWQSVTAPDNANGAATAMRPLSKDGPTSNKFMYKVRMRVFVTPDGLSNRDPADPTTPTAYDSDIWGNDQRRHMYDDGNIGPDVQVSFQVKRYQLNEDDEFTDAAGVVLSEPAPTSKFETRTWPMHTDDILDPPNNGALRCTAFNSAGNDRDDTATAWKYCPPGTRFQSLGDSAVQTYDAGDPTENQASFVAPLATGTGVGLRARFHPTDEDDLPPPPVVIQYYKVCEPRFDSELDAWERFQEGLEDE